MIPKEFDYVAPATIEEALGALRDGGEDAKVLAGGHSLIPLMKLRLAAPSLLVDLRKIGDLRNVGSADGNVSIGAMVTHNTLMTSRDLLDTCPLISECAASIGDEQVRARGTIGGSIAHGDPAADLPAALLAMDGVVTVAHMNGGVTMREIPSSDFFVDLLTTALEDGEILTGIRVPRLPSGTGTAYVKIRNKASHYALVGAAVVLTIGQDETCTNAAIAITGAASKPFRLTQVEDALKGTRASETDVSSAIGSIEGLDVDWMSDLQGSEEYRRHLTGVVTARAVQAARGRIQA
jgi:carbon-monoxide dehydrogenase medium subunit